jgi:hypothetical protein
MCDANTIVFIVIISAVTSFLTYFLIILGMNILIAGGYKKWVLRAGEPSEINEGDNGFCKHKKK